MNPYEKTPPGNRARSVGRRRGRLQSAGAATRSHAVLCFVAGSGRRGRFHHLDRAAGARRRSDQVSRLSQAARRGHSRPVRTVSWSRTRSAGASPWIVTFESVLCQNLSQMLGTEKIITYPWYSDTHIDYQVEVRVFRFEATADGHSQMTAVWTIRDGHDGHELATTSRPSRIHPCRAVTGRLRRFEPGPRPVEPPD